MKNILKISLSMTFFLLIFSQVVEAESFLDRAKRKAEEALKSKAAEAIGDVIGDRQSQSIEKELEDPIDIIELQQLLNVIGTQYRFSVGAPDGTIGPATRRAISKVQELQRLPIDGRATLSILDVARSTAAPIQKKQQRKVVSNKSSPSKQGGSTSAASLEKMDSGGSKNTQLDSLASYPFEASLSMEQRSMP